MEVFLADIKEDSELGIWLAEQDGNNNGNSNINNINKGLTEFKEGSVSNKEANDTTSPDYPQWVEARSKERCKLEQYKSWRRISPEEMDKVRSGESFNFKLLY